MDIRKVAATLYASELTNNKILAFGIRAARELAADDNEEDPGGEVDTEEAMVHIERMMRERFGSHKIWLSTQDWDYIMNEYIRLRT